MAWTLMNPASRILVSRYSPGLLTRPVFAITESKHSSQRRKAESSASEPS
jgi:hypothetical protein